MSKELQERADRVIEELNDALYQLGKELSRFRKRPMIP